MSFLCFNVGSSSLEFALFEGEDERLRGGIDTSVDSEIRYGPPGAKDQLLSLDDPTDFPAAAVAVLDLSGGEATPVHRIVHGGERDAAAGWLTEDEVARLADLAPLAPIHQHANLAPARAIAEVRPGVRQIAVYDSAFHRSMPDIARALPVAPEGPFDGLRRYGFHGLSHGWVARRMAELAPERERIVSLHLSGGCSACAIRKGQSVDTTMGATPLDGMMMGTRSGAVDPGALLYALDRGMSLEELGDLLWHRGGLMGVSGVSKDVRDLFPSDDPRAGFAVEMFCRSVAKAAAQMIVSLGGIDALVFTGGMGAQQPEIRRRIVDDLAWTGLELAPDRNEADADLVSAEGSTAEIRIIPAEEERMMALEAAKLEDAE